MADLGADYSYARPGGAALAAKGVKAVGRYLADDGRGITSAEYADLKAHGIGVWLVREGAASGMLSGAAQGVADAQAAVRLLASNGFPANTVVYATADFAVQNAQFPACDAYMDGFASVIGLARTGIYGGLHYLNHIFQVSKAAWFWQAGATSWDAGETAQMTVHLHQTTNTPPVPGTDHNFINVPNFGQVGAATTQEDDMELITVFADTNFTDAQKATPVYGSTAVIHPVTGFIQVSTGLGPRGTLDAYKAIAGVLGMTITEKHVDNAGWSLSQLFKPPAAKLDLTAATASIIAALKAAIPDAAGVDYDKIGTVVDAALADNFAAIPDATVAELGTAITGK